MEIRKFEEFCYDKGASARFKEAFYHYLMALYPEGVPADLNLQDEWVKFLREAGSWVK